VRRDGDKLRRKEMGGDSSDMSLFLFEHSSSLCLLFPLLIDLILSLFNQFVSEAMKGIVTQLLKTFFVGEQFCIKITKFFELKLSTPITIKFREQLFHEDIKFVICEEREIRTERERREREEREERERGEREREEGDLEVLNSNQQQAPLHCVRMLRHSRTL
jgi:hypothetical protein